MAVRVLLGAVAGAVVLMAWGFAYWVLLGAPGSALRSAPDETQLMEHLRADLPQSGAYAFPVPGAMGGDGAAALEGYRQRHLAGPIGLILYTREGRDPLSPRVYVQGLLQALAASLLAALLLTMALSALDGFSQRLTFVFGMGLFAQIAVRGYDPIWWNLPWDHAVQMAAYQGIGWFLVAAVLAALVRPVRWGGYHDTDPSKPLWKRALDVE